MPQRRNRGSWYFGDPRASAAGSKGGATIRKGSVVRTPEYCKGYLAGWIAGKRRAADPGASGTRPDRRQPR